MHLGHYISIPLVTQKNQNKSILHVNFIYRISKLPGQSCVRCRSIPLVSASSQSYEDGALAQTGLTDGIGKHATSWTLELATQLELGGPTGRAPDARAGPSIDRIARVVAPPAFDCTSQSSLEPGGAKTLLPAGTTCLHLHKCTRTARSDKEKVQFSFSNYRKSLIFNLQL